MRGTCSGITDRCTRVTCDLALAESIWISPWMTGIAGSSITGQAGVLLGTAIVATCMGLLGRAVIGGWIGVTVGVVLGVGAVGLHAVSYLLAGGVINGYGHAGTVRRRRAGECAEHAGDRNGRRRVKDGIAITTKPRTRLASDSADNSTSGGSRSVRCAAFGWLTSPLVAGRGSTDSGRDARAFARRTPGCG